MKYEVKPQRVCPSMMSFELEEDVVRNVEFTDGCNGNLKAISKLVDGMTVDQLEGMLKGNTCGKNPTSCVDQLVQAVRQKYEETKQA